ncbi:pseudouridylate synthase 7 homolog-like protein [Strongylocentrotus purpuratus]|uniref:Pseudouridylate synthase PUS7L n=1 Tax=Strongylocentrotus purpuratus TaxID=7668 RepID=A0A7M7MYR1_STRPU|nr:pseudouridylate synthase 7 homolog-like protein [Strongylocentrotus purpuratus]XP_030828694.1 pseudouridylate synthase 7 homolog-like protein [Strongylocentrotus purpuratus]
MFGIECYVSQHEGFKGNVKTSPKDFQVTEISPDGRLASLIDIKIDLSSKLGIKFRDGSEHSNTSAIDSTPTPLHSKAASDTSTSTSVIDSHIQSELSSIQVNKVKVSQEGFIPKDSRKCLENVLDKDIFIELEKFATIELKSLGRSNPESCTETNTASSTILEPHQAHLNLGLISSKESRTIIHKCVRHLYPHLRTKVHKVPDQGGLEIHISREPGIAEFQDLQIPLSKVLEFFKFVELRDREQTFCFEGLESKDQRTKLHRLVAKHYGSFLETKTFGDGASTREHQKIVVRFRQIKDHKKRKGGDGHSARDSVLTGFTLQKTNTETLSAIQQLARLMGVQISDFTYAGIKDKKAVTTQEMAVKGITITRLQDVSKELPGWLKVGSIHSRNKSMVTGELWGNHFDITLQNIEMKNGSNEVRAGTVEDKGRELQNCIEQCIRCVEDRGFINYYGEQRFGASSVDPSKALTTISPADVGCAMLQGKYKEAIDLILSPDDGPCADPSNATNVAKHCFQQTGSPREALKQMPTMKTRECLLLKGLNRHGTDDDGCIKALMNIPHNMRQMYVHAFCSLVWNQMASWRMCRYGCQVVEGDLVCIEDLGTKVHAVTEDDITQGKYSLTEVMLPLPGNNIQYPSHTAGAEYQRRLDEAGLGECNFRIPALKLNVPGGYRKVIAQPRNLEWGWGVSRDKHVDNEDDREDYTRDTKDAPLPSNHAASPFGNTSDALSSSSIVTVGCPNLMEASGRHMELSCNESDSDPAVCYSEKTNEISAGRPLGSPACVSECHMVSYSADIKDDFTASIYDNTLSTDTTKAIGGPNSADSPTLYHNDISQSLCHSRDKSSYTNTQCDVSQSSSLSCQRKTLNLSFDLPASCYATVFLRELKKS